MCLLRGPVCPTRVIQVHHLGLQIPRSLPMRCVHVKMNERSFVDSTAQPAINHRMFVLEGDGPNPWAADFTLKGELNTYDQFAIDGTYFIHNQQIYHIYSCWQEQTSAWPANLCITHMSDPWTVDTNLTDRRMISVPNEPWERVPYGRPDTRLATNEGPQQLINPTTGQNFVIYSAARVNTPFYCLGKRAPACPKSCCALRPFQLCPPLCRVE